MFDKFARLIQRAKRQFKTTDEALADLLREEDIECTARAIFAWRTGAREPEHNARCWIEQQLQRLLKRRR